MLVSTIAAIRREHKMFESVGERYSLSLNPEGSKQSAGLEMYVALFSSVAQMGVLEGLVLLWATEVCYLRAWQYAARLLGEGVAEQGQDADGGALRNEFVPNWTSEEFMGFVQMLGALVDEVWEAREEGVLVEREGELEGSKASVDLEGIWKDVLQAEREFWPRVGGE